MTRRPADPITPLGKALRDLRDDAGLTGPQAAKSAGISQTALSRYELGERTPTPAIVRELCRVYRVTGGRRRELLDVASAVHDGDVDVAAMRKRNEMRKVNDRIDSVEMSAQVITAWKPGWIDGDCQTRAYAAAMFNEGDGWTVEQAEAAVDARMKRQELLHSDRQFRIAHTEGALMWCMGSPAVMVRQMDHLIEVSHLPNVELGVVPFGVPARMTPLHNFTIFDRSSVHFGTGHRTEFVADHRDVQEYLGRWARFEPLIRWGDDARDVFARVRDWFAGL